MEGVEEMPSNKITIPEGIRYEKLMPLPAMPLSAV